MEDYIHVNPSLKSFDLEGFRPFPQECSILLVFLFFFVTLKCHCAWFLYFGTNTLAVFPNCRTPHHIIFIFLLCETYQRPSLCHRKAPVPKGSGQSRVFPARWVHQSVWGWVRRNTHQQLPPYGTLAARCRPLTCLYWRQCAGGQSFFQAQCTHMVLTRRNATGQIHDTSLPRVFHEFSWLQNNCPSTVVWVGQSELHCLWKTDANQDPSFHYSS